MSDPIASASLPLTAAHVADPSQAGLQLMPAISIIRPGDASAPGGPVTMTTPGE